LNEVGGFHRHHRPEIASAGRQGLFRDFVQMAQSSVHRLKILLNDGFSFFNIRFADGLFDKEKRIVLGDGGKFNMRAETKRKRNET
jgi:hypothetical protein